MKYFTLVYKEYFEKDATKSIYEYDTQKEAVTSYHDNMTKCMKDDTCKSALVEARNTYGGSYKSSFYKNDKGAIDSAL